MKTLIVNPPVEGSFERSGRWPSKSTGGGFQEPLFLAYAAAVLEKENLPVELIDCRPDYLTIDDLQKRITKDVGLIVLQTSTPSIELDLETAESLKKKNQKIKIALLGPHVSVLDKEIMRVNKSIDFILRGEYEYILRDLVKTLIKNKNLKEVKGLTYREGEKIIRNPSMPLIENLDELPFPARHFLPNEKYFEPLFIGKPTLRLITSRGCPFFCTFCLWPQVMYGRKIRYRNIGNVIEEIKELKEKYKIKEFYFDDDTFTLDEKRVINLCKAIIKNKINLPWDCLGRVNMVTKKMLYWMKKAGCILIRYGVESGSQEILNRCKKGFTTDDIKRAFKMTHELGIKTHATVMFGLPGETKETIKKTIDFILKLNPSYVQFAIATPYPGTEYYNEVKKNGWLIAKNWSDYDPIGKSPVSYPNLSAKEINQAIKIAYKKFYLRPSYLFRKIIQAKSVGEYQQLFSAGFSLFKKLFYE